MCYDLLVFDIANSLIDEQLNVLGDCSLSYLSSNTSTKLNKELIQARVSELSSYFDNNFIDKVKNKLKGENILDVIRGHFLSHFVINLIKKNIASVKKERQNIHNRRRKPKIPTINCDNLLVETIDNCRICNKKCKKYKDLLNDIKNAVDFIKCS